MRTRTRRPKTLWAAVFLLAGAAAVGVDYPDPVCALRGSTVTLPCTFTPVDSTTRGGPPIRIIRVRWCRNHQICHGTTPSVVDITEGTRQESHYKYLGDLQRNCTLQISGVQKQDAGTLRFRMEANNSTGHFTGQSGVNVTVVEEVMKIQVSGSNAAGTRGQAAGVRGQAAGGQAAGGQAAGGQAAGAQGQAAGARGQTLRLLCTASCTFHALKVTWLKDGHALPESGPALELGPLTGEDSGNYTCSLKTFSGSTSPPFRLQVEDPAAEAGPDVSLVLGLVFGLLLLLLFIVIFIICIIKRRRAAADEDGDEGPAAVGRGLNQQTPNSLHSDVTVDREYQEIGRDLDDISYAAIHFQHKNQANCLETAEDAVVYSSIVNRG
ncbi:uncharacterized protein V6R79_018796 [Siganus canaliculatus]